MKLNILIMLPIIIYSQNVDMYLSLIHEGQSEGVKEILPELISKYPNDPGVVYLQAMLTTNGMKSLELYSKIIEKFPKSDFAGPASVKIGEYFYAQGLYSQAGMQLRLIPRKYPRIENMQSIIDMVISSFLAIGEGDSVKYYVGIYRGMFPNLDFEKFGIDSPSIPSIEDSAPDVETPAFCILSIVLSTSFITRLAPCAACGPSCTISDVLSKLYGSNSIVVSSNSFER